MVRSDDPSSPKRQKTEDGRRKRPAITAVRRISIPTSAPTRRCTCSTKSWIGSAGLGFEIDFKKFRYCFGWRPLDLDDSTMVDEPETNRDFIATLVNMALTKHNEERGASLELGKVLIANFHPSCAVTFYISFQVNDPSDGNQTKPYRAVVRYFPGDIEVVSCYPKI
ncbi:BnaC02g02470D [Brassica napus]|uniref:BnaC02g02470D protein n=2 Tax=Brassica TaxID=3705 RepID=A0A078FI77_BRANA|nr:PREDICTED: uncharacterized protein LOC106323130 [Brassica oleracea var. oleracea]CDY14130.1 BnaC02g02470D [Brassica napus]